MSSLKVGGRDFEETEEIESSARGEIENAIFSALPVTAEEDVVDEEDEELDDKSESQSLKGSEVSINEPGLERSESQLEEVSSEEEEEEEEEEPVVEGQRRRKKETLGEDYTLYVLAMRCFIHPMSNLQVVERNDRAKKLANFLKMPRNELFSQSEHRITASEMKSIRVKIAKRCTEELSDSEDCDEILVSSLKAFVEKIKLDEKALIEKGKNTETVYGNIFKEICSRDIKQQEGKVSTDALQSRCREFSLIISNVVGAINDSRSPLSKKALIGTASGFGSASGSRLSMHHNRSKSAVSSASLVSTQSDDRATFESEHRILMKPFHVPRSEHEAIYNREERVNDNALVGRELRTRLIGLQTHNFYNKDSFIHKTGGYLKWKNCEEENIKAMLQSLGEPVEPVTRSPSIQSVISNSDTLEDPEAYKGGELIVGVIKARSLIGKDKTGYSDPYCIVEYDGNMRKTKTLPKNLNPVWEEACVYSVKAKDDGKPISFKVTVWDEDAVEDSVTGFFTGKKSLNFKALMDRDDFLGQIEVKNLDVNELKYPREQWYKLEKRSRRSTVGGDIFLRIEFVPNRRKQEEKRAKLEEKEKDEELKKRKEAEWKAANLPDYHAYFERLFSKIFTYEIEKHMKKKNKGVFQISEGYEQLLEEFGVRYGVGKLFRDIVSLSFTAEAFEEGKVEISGLIYRIEENNKHEERRRWTTIEYKRYSDTLANLEKILVMNISHYKDYFPYSAPAGFLRGYIRALVDVYQDAIYKEKHQYAQNVIEVIQSCVQTSCTNIYGRFSAMSAPLQIKPKTSDILNQLSVLVDCIVIEIESDVFYFKEDFVSKDLDQVAQQIGEPQFDMINHSVSTYGLLLSADVENIMGHNFKQNFTPEVMQVYFILQKFNTKTMALVNDNTNVKFKGFPLSYMFLPYIRRWLAFMKNKTITWALNSLRIDKFDKTSDKVLHSASCLDMFWSLTAMYEFLQKLKWDDELQFQEILADYAEAIHFCIRQYLEEISRIARKMIMGMTQQGQENENKKFMPSEKMCVVINNIEATYQQMKKLCEAMGYADIFHETILIDLKSNAGLTVTSDDAVKDKLLHTKHLVLASLSVVCDQLTSQFRLDIQNAIHSVSGFSTYTDKVSSFFGFGSRSNPNITQSSTTEDRLRPLVTYFEEVFGFLSQNTYKNVFLRMLMAMWEEVLYCTEQVIAKENYEHPNGLLRLEDTLPILVNFFYGDDEGLSKDMLQSQRYRLLLDIIQVIRIGDGDKLVTLHGFSTSPAQSKLLLQVMGNMKDRNVQEYLKSLRD